MRRLPPVVLVLAMAAACGKPAPASAHQPTEHERDSILAQSRLPHASAVRGALRVQAIGADRVAREDSVSNTP